jgi:hypothetical protein
VSNRRSREARAIQAETGVPYMEALREADRRHAEKSAPGVTPPLSACQERIQAGRGAAGTEPSAGEFLRNLLAPVSQPGPPYTHTIVPPEPVGVDEDGNLIYPEPGPSYTLTAGEIRPPGPRTEITADFCQCPACRAERCEP